MASSTDEVDHYLVVVADPGPLRQFYAGELDLRTLALTAIITIQNTNWGGLSIQAMTMVFITVAPIMLTLKMGDIPFPPSINFPTVADPWP